MAGTPRERLIIWLWRQLPLRGPARLAIAWICNLRYAVGVAAVITNERGEVLLLEHTYMRGSYTWGLPGGWATGRESLERAIVRELREETGFVLTVDRLVAVHSGYGLPRMTVVYRAHIVSGAFRPSAEVSGHAFCPPDALKPILPGERQAICEALR